MDWLGVEFAPGKLWFCPNVNPVDGGCELAIGEDTVLGSMGLKAPPNVGAGAPALPAGVWRLERIGRILKSVSVKVYVCQKRVKDDM